MLMDMTLPVRESTVMNRKMEFSPCKTNKYQVHTFWASRPGTIYAYRLDAQYARERSGSCTAGRVLHRIRS